MEVKNVDPRSKQQSEGAVGSRQLVEMILEESIRYKASDPVEAWLNKLLCLDAAAAALTQSGCPAPNDCQL